MLLTLAKAVILTISDIAKSKIIETQSNSHASSCKAYISGKQDQLRYLVVGYLPRHPAYDAISKSNQPLFDISLQRKQVSRLAFFIYPALLIVLYRSIEVL